MMKSISAPDTLPMSLANILAKVYPEPAAVIVTDVTALPDTTTVAVPLDPSPRILTPVYVPLVPPEPAAVIFTCSIAPAVVEKSEDSVDTCIKSDDKKFVCSEAVNEYIYFHR